MKVQKNEKHGDEQVHEGDDRKENSHIKASKDKLFGDLMSTTINSGVLDEQNIHGIAVISYLRPNLGLS